MTGSIRNRSKPGKSRWQIVLERGMDHSGKRQRDYITIDGTRKQAQQLLTEKLNEYNKGMYIEPSRITVEQLMELWMESHVKARLAENTIRGYRSNLKNHLIPILGGVSLQKLTPAHIQLLMDKLQKKGLKGTSIRFICATLHEALEYAYRMQMVSRNVMKFVTKIKTDKFKATSYSEEEVIAMLTAAKGYQVEILVQLAVGLGLRRGELLALKWSDIDLDSQKMTISRNLVHVDGQSIFRKPKTEAGSRVIDVPSGLIDILKRHKKQQTEQKVRLGASYHDQGLVCATPDGSPYNPGNVSHLFGDFLKRKGLRHIRFHDLRHTNASLMLMYNVPAKVASQRLGHSSIGITLDMYTHVIGNMQTEAASKIDDGIFQKMKWTSG